VSSLDTTRTTHAMRSAATIADMCLRFAVVGSVMMFLLALLAAPSALAAPAWLAPVGVSEGGSQAEGGHQASEPRVAFDEQGDALAVWSSEDGTLSGGSKKYEVQAAFRSAGGAWQAPETLSLYGQSADDASVAFDGKDDAVAVWEAYNGDTFVVEGSYRPAGGAWQAPVYLSPEEIPGTAHPQVAFDKQGSAIAVWNRGGPSGGPVQAALMPAGGAWQAPVEIAELGDEPQVAFDAQGNAMVLWSHVASYVDYTYEYIVQSAFKPANGAWQAPVDVSALGSAGGLHVTFDEQGDAAAIWDQWTSGSLSPRTVQTASMPAGGAWQAPVDIVGAAEERDQPKGAGDPGIAVDGQGDTVAVWTWAFGGTVQAAFKPTGGTWQPPLNISGEGASSPQVAFDGQGDALAAWDSGSGAVQAAFKPASGAWQAPVDIGSGGGPQIAFDGQGDVLAAWTDEGGIQAVGYAAVGPALNGLSMPTNGTVGQPVTFSVSPLDVWSASGETSWSFGDGTTANGTSVTHTYTAAGTYEVTLHSTDTLGNVTSTVGKITVAPPTATPTPSPPTSTTAGPETSTVTTPLVTLMASELLVLGDTAPVGIECQAAACRGSIELTAQAPTRTGKGKTAADRKTTLVLAKGSFSLAEGKRGTVVLHLTATGKKRLAHASRRHPVEAKLILSIQSGKTTTKTVLAV
jgi:hypothetical protein